MSLQTANRDVTINISLSGNDSGRLFGENDSWATCHIVQPLPRKPKGLQASYYKLFIQLSYNQQQDCFHSIVVGASQWFFHKFLIYIFPNCSGQYWYIVYVRLVEIIWDCMNFILFACVFLRTIISFTFVVSICLRIFVFVVFVLTLFLFWIYTDTIDDNIFSVPLWLFQLRRSLFWFNITQSTILQVFKFQYLL